MRKVIMAIGAHADDIEGRVGGTLLKYCDKGYRGVYVLTTNNTCGASEPQTPKEHATFRRSDATEAAKVLGVEPIFLDFKEAQIQSADKWLPVNYDPVDLSGYPAWGQGKALIPCAPDVEEAVEEVADLFCRYEPEYIIAHGVAGNPEHWETGVLALRAFQRARRRASLGTFCYWQDFALIGLMPDIFVDVTDYMWMKYEAVSKHVHQGLADAHDHLPHMRERFWGSFIGVEYAEVFFTIARGNEL